MSDDRSPDPSTDDTRWQRVRALFDEAAELDPEARRTFLEGLGDDDLVSEVESLLAALQQEEGFLETPAADLLTDPPVADDSSHLTGKRVGPYILLRLIGSGGMGVVYEAERADEHYRQRVAIKLMKTGAGSEMVAERFRRERQILAGLDHPGIARLLDGGVTEDGKPYFVMDLIDGIPITEYCARNSLSLRQRLELFRYVCEAVHFAHRNLVVHRDLKPGNVLVTPEGRIKLLDFGIAKVLAADESGEQTLTLLVGRMLTPAYASPEQVQGDQVTTATDVYSLGVVLYELLTGRKPFEFDGPSLQDSIEEMVGTEPTRPSDAVTQETVPQFGDGALKRVRRTLEGELDNIVLMALQKEPEGRYQSVAQLSDDVRRYLSGLPVVAQRDTPAYRARKFVARHRTGAIAAAAILVLLVAGLGATLTQARRADRERTSAEARFNETRELANALLFDLHDAVAGLPGSTAAREMLVTRGLEYLDGLAEGTTDDPEIQAELAGAYLQLGLVLGTPTGASLGQVSQAEASFERSLSIAEGLVERDPGNDAIRRTLALAHEQLGDVMAFRGAIDEGVQHARQALGLWSYFAESQPDQERAKLSAVISHVKLGDLLGNPNFNNAGEEEAAVGEYRYALSLLRSPPLAASEDVGVRRYRGLVNERLGSMLRQQERPAEALVALEEALDVRVSLAEGGNSEFLRDVAVTHHQLCGVRLTLGELPAAVRSCEEMLNLYRSLFDQDPDNAQAARDLALGHEMDFALATSRGSPEAAAAALRAGVAVREGLMSRAPDDLVNRRDWARALIHLCEAEQTAALPSAEANCRRGRTTLIELREAGVTTDEDETLIELAASLQ